MRCVWRQILFQRRPKRRCPNRRAPLRRIAPCFPKPRFCREGLWNTLDLSDFTQPFAHVICDQFDDMLLTLSQVSCEPSPMAEIWKLSRGTARNSGTNPKTHPWIRIRHAIVSTGSRLEINPFHLLFWWWWEDNMIQVFLIIGRRGSVVKNSLHAISFLWRESLGFDPRSRRNPDGKLKVRNSQRCNISLVCEIKYLSNAPINNVVGSVVPG